MADSMSERDAFYNDALDFAFESGLSREEAYAFADRQKAIRDRSIRGRKKRGGAPSERIRERMAQERPATGGGGGAGGLSFDVSRDLAPVEQYDPRSEEDKRRSPMPAGVDYKYRIDRNLYPDMETGLEPVADIGTDDRGLPPDDDEDLPPEPTGGSGGGLRQRIQAFGHTPGLQGLGTEQDTNYQAQHEMLMQQSSDLAEGQKKLGGMYSEAADVYRKQQAGMQMLQKANTEARREAISEIKDVENSISKFKIDPNRAFPSLGGRILAAVSIAVGAFAQGLSHGKLPNTALQIIMDAVNKDIDAQKHDFQTKKTVLQNKNNLYAQLLNTHGHEEKARQLAMNGALHYAQMRIQQISNTIAGQKAQQGIQQLLKQLDARRTDGKLDIIKTAKDNKYRSLMMEIGLERQQSGGRGGPAGKQERSQELIKRATRLIDQQIKNSLKAHNADKEGGITDALRRALGSGFLALGADTPGYMTLRPEHIEVFQGNTFIGQTLMKAFQGGNPSNHDAKTFMRVLPPLTTDHKIRKAAYESLKRWAVASTNNGTQPIAPGQLARDAAAGKLGKLYKQPSPTMFNTFKQEADIVTIEDVRRRGI